MSFINFFKRYFIKANSQEYANIIKEMKAAIDGLNADFLKLVSLQDELKNNPQIILQMEFDKKDEYLEIMDSIKHKDINLIKEYQLIVLKYNILIELYKKMKRKVSEFGSNLIIEFAHNKYNQPIILMSPYMIDLHKIILVSSAPEEDYIEFGINNNTLLIKTIKIVEDDDYILNLLIEMLFNTIKKYNDESIFNIHKVEYQKKYANEIPKTYITFLLNNKDFREIEGIFTKNI